MARPRTDTEAVRAQLLEAADALIRRNRGATLSVKDLAAECGMSPSNAYRFFPSKAALLGAVAERWFAEVEETFRVALASKADAMAGLRAALDAQLRLKRASYHADPDLFRAYLALAERNPELVAGHVDRLRALLVDTVGRIAPGDAGAVALVEDMTLSIRDPNHLARMRGQITDARMTALLDAVETALTARKGRTGAAP